MKINAVITPKKLNIKENTLSKNKITVTTFLIMILGIIFGAVFYNFAHSELKNNLEIAFRSFNDDFINKSKPEILSGLLLTALVYIVLVFLFSTSVIGAPFIYSLTFFKLLGLGTLVSYIYSSYGLKGVEYCILILLPGKFFMILGSLILTDSSVYFSRSIRKISDNNKAELKKQFAIFIIVLIIFTVSVAVDYFTLIFFSDLFSF